MITSYVIDNHDHAIIGKPCKICGLFSTAVVPPSYVKRSIICAECIIANPARSDVISFTLRSGKHGKTCKIVELGETA